VMHEHGTVVAYNADRCRCPECRAAKAAGQRLERQKRARLRWSHGRDTLRVEATGTHRRLQALRVIGWSLSALGAELGVSKRAVSFLHVYEHVSEDTAARVAAVYDRCWDKPQHGDRADLARSYALGLGWVPPLAWDEDDLDDPTAKPHTPADRWQLRPCGTHAAYRRHERPCETCRHAENRRRHDRKKAA
jgi:hypothetical protein